MSEMTGYGLTRDWFDWAFDNPDLNTPTHTALYLWYVEKWNRCGQKEKISVTTSESMDAIGVKSRNTLSKVFGDLVKWGFVRVVVESKNQYACNIITLAQNLSKHEDSTRTTLDKALIQHSSKHEDNTVASTRTINKQVNKETSKQVNKEHDIREGEIFDFFGKEPETDLVGDTTEKIPPSSARPPLSLKAKVAEAGKFVEHPFEEDELFDKEKFRTLVEEKNPELDADYYYLAVCGWRDKYGKPPKRKVWASVVNQFLLNDHKKGQLQFKKKHPTETSNRNANPASTQYVKPSFEDVLAIVNERYFGKAE